MKRKTAGAVLSVILAAGMAMTPVYAQAAEQTTEQTTEAASETEKAASAETTQAAEDENGAEASEEASDFSVTLGGTETTVKNNTGITFSGAEFKKEDGKETGTLTLTEESGTVHTFEEVADTALTEPECYEEYGFIYIKYQDAQGKEQELAEKADETELEKAVTVYALSNVNIRKEADKTSERLDGVKVGDELTVSAAAPGWLKIKTDKAEGYVAHSYFTEDKAKAEENKKAAEEAARAAAEQQAAAEAAAAAAETDYSYDDYDYDYEEPAAEPAAPTVVSEQDYPDCDGSEHGYREITYSDGTVEYQDY